jgi:hypothetical protein
MGRADAHGKGFASKVIRFFQRLKAGFGISEKTRALASSALGGVEILIGFG